MTKPYERFRVLDDSDWCIEKEMNIFGVEELDKNEQEVVKKYLKLQKRKRKEMFEAKYMLCPEEKNFIRQDAYKTNFNEYFETVLRVETKPETFDEKVKRLKELYRFNIFDLKWLHYKAYELWLENKQHTEIDTLLFELTCELADRYPVYIVRRAFEEKSGLFDVHKTEFIDPVMGAWSPLKKLGQSEIDEIKKMDDFQKRKLVEIKNLLSDLFFASTWERIKVYSRVKNRIRQIKNELQRAGKYTRIHNEYVKLLSKRSLIKFKIFKLIKQTVKGTKNIFAAIGTFLTKALPRCIGDVIRKYIRDDGSILATFTKLAKTVFKTPTIAKIVACAFVYLLGEIVDVIADKIIGLLPLKLQVKIRAMLERIEQGLKIYFTFDVVKRIVTWLISTLGNKKLACTFA